jgi:RNA polymerase sigma-70 factor (ECF subfamily)
MDRLPPTASIRSVSPVSPEPAASAGTKPAPSSVISTRSLGPSSDNDSPAAGEAERLLAAGLAEEALAGPDHDRKTISRSSSGSSRFPTLSSRVSSRCHLDALVDLLTDDVFMSTPPMPFEYEGRDVVARFCASLFGAGHRFDLVPARANGRPAFGAYLRTPDGIRHGTGLYVLTLAGDRICAMTRFDNSVLPSFGLPRSLPGR